MKAYSGYLRILSVLVSILVLLMPASFALASASTTGLKYDKAGNLLEDKSHKYEYDGFNQLRRVLDTTGKLLEEYWYNDQGQRIKKVKHDENGSQETTYYLGKSFQRTISTEGTKDTAYVYLGDQLIAKKENNETNYYHPDNLGSTSLVTDSEGEVVEKTSYFPFGGVDEGGLESKRLYTGKELDDTGMVYFGARYYSPKLARFIQPDTIQPDIYDPQQLNRYAYARNNPYKYTDPTGNFAFLAPLLYIAATFIFATVTAALTTYLPATVAVAYDNIQNYGAGKGTAITAGEMLVGGAVGEVVGHTAGRVAGWAAKKVGPAIRKMFTSAEEMMASKSGSLKPGGVSAKVGSNAFSELRKFGGKDVPFPKYPTGNDNHILQGHHDLHFEPSNSKFLPGEGGQKFADEIYSKGNIQQTFRNRYMIDADLGRVVGTRGETRGRIIIDRGTGEVITQFPRRGR